MKKIFYFILIFFFGFSSLSFGEYYAGWTVGRARDGYGAIYSTIDSGTNWERQGSNQIADVNLYGVFAIDPNTAWVVGSSNSGYATIYYTNDGGNTWERKGIGSPALSNVSLSKVHVSSNNIWATGFGAIIHSSDNGNSWTNCIPVEYTNILLQGIFSINGSTVWVSGAGTSKTDYATMLKTTDGGQSWIRQSGGIITNINHLLGISAANPQELWAVGGGGFITLHSNDGGNSWTLQSQSSNYGDANEVSAVNSNTVWVANDNFVQWSFDGGITWSNKTSFFYTMGITAVNETEAWSAICDAIYNKGYVNHTSDGGQNWEQQLSTAPPLWTISFAHEAIPEPIHILLFIYQIFLITHRKFYD